MNFSLFSGLNTLGFMIILLLSSTFSLGLKNHCTSCFEIPYLKFRRQDFYLEKSSTCWTYIWTNRIRLHSLHNLNQTYLPTYVVYLKLQNLLKHSSTSHTFPYQIHSSSSLSHNNQIKYSAKKQFQYRINSRIDAHTRPNFEFFFA